MSLAEKYRASLLGGALGDALGAPIEVLKSFEDIRAKHGPKGLQDFAVYDSGWLDDAEGGLGAITDDTGMSVMTAAAMAQGGEDTAEASLRRIWQAYLHWGSRQQDGQGLEKLLTSGGFSVTAEAAPFLFRTGAGRGTIAALYEGRVGTPENPLMYDRIVRGKRVVGPNTGCGGMMRVAPVAFFFNKSARDEMMDFAGRTAAITHGHPVAIAASAGIAGLVHDVAHGVPLRGALTNAHYVESPDTKAHRDLSAAFRVATAYATEKSFDPAHIEKLGHVLGSKNAFLALPVWAQTIYALTSVAGDHMPPTPESFKKALVLAANHGGDSDSVASIVGQVLGAAWGPKALPQDWLTKLQHRDHLEALARKTAPALAAA